MGNVICPCGERIALKVGIGRPRKFCTKCRPPRDRGYMPASRGRTCVACGTGFDGIGTAQYCSDACKWLLRPRIPCATCGGLTGWSSSRTDKIGSVCADCRRRQAESEHGVAASYRRGCRCIQCRAAATREHRNYRAKRRSEGRPVKRFGGSGYWIAESVRVAVFERDAWVCQLCGDPTDRNAAPNSDWFPSLDHIEPASKGGAHTFENLRVAHRWCNAVRGAEDHHSDLFQEA